MTKVCSRGAVIIRHNELEESLIVPIVQLNTQFQRHFRLHSSAWPIKVNLTLVLFDINTQPISSFIFRTNFWLDHEADDFPIDGTDNIHMTWERVLYFTGRLFLSPHVVTDNKANLFNSIRHYQLHNFWTMIMTWAFPRLATRHAHEHIISRRPIWSGSTVKCCKHWAGLDLIIKDHMLPSVNSKNSFLFTNFLFHIGRMILLSRLGVIYWSSFSSTLFQDAPALS